MLYAHTPTKRHPATSATCLATSCVPPGACVLRSSATAGTRSADATATNARPSGRAASVPVRARSAVHVAAVTNRAVARRSSTWLIGRARGT
ncbi:Uncharacterised protein [Mycobacteroides abscessus]|nr:Uncharacterised protein [Mycobacteroides abscessus]